MNNIAIINRHLFHFYTLLSYVRSERHSLDKWVVIVYYAEGQEADIEKHYKVASTYDLGRIMYICLNRYRNSKNILKLFSIFKLPLFILKTLKRTRYNQIVVGNYNSQHTIAISKLFGYDKIVFLDEGSSTIRVSQTRKSLNFDNYVLSRSWKWGIRKIIHPGPSTFYTVYDNLSFGPFDNVLKCQYGELLTDRTIDQNAVIFLGSPLYVPRYDFVNRQDYLKLILFIASKYEKEGARFCYKPHQVEDKAMIDALTANKIKIIDSTKPVELMLLSDDTIPAILASFVTSCFATIDNLFNGRIKLESFLVAKGLFKSDFERFNEVYNHYKENSAGWNIEVIDIDLSN